MLVCLHRLQKIGKFTRIVPGRIRVGVGRPQIGQTALPFFTSSLIGALGCVKSFDVPGTIFLYVTS